MLQPISSFKEALRLTLIIERVDAYDLETGAILRQSRGHSSQITKWWLFFAESEDSSGKFRPYKEWRHTFRAATLDEAIEHANRKLHQFQSAGKAGRKRY